MSPVADTKDYIFYITIPNEKKFVFFFIHTTNFVVVNENLPKAPKSFSFLGPGSPGHRDYFCAVDPAVDYYYLTGQLQRLFSNVGATSQASSQILLVMEDTSSKTKAWQGFKAQADLVLWDAVWLGTTPERDKGLFYDTVNEVSDIPHDTVSDLHADWSCEEII